MKRRNVLAALGTLSAGGAFTVGSGAFTSVSADRSITVDVVGDANAFLRLAPCTGEDGDPLPNGDYVANASEGAMAIDLADGDSGVSGSGVNPEAHSVFNNVFEICNQGTQSVCVDFAVDVPSIPDETDVPDRYDFGSGDPAVVFYRADNPDEPISVDEVEVDRRGAFQLDVSDCQCVGMEVRAFGFESITDLFEDADLTIRAEAGANCVNNGIGEPGPDVVRLDNELYIDQVADNQPEQDLFEDGLTGEFSREDDRLNFYAFLPASDDPDAGSGGGVELAVGTADPLDLTGIEELFIDWKHDSSDSGQYTNQDRSYFGVAEDRAEIKRSNIDNGGVERDILNADTVFSRKTDSLDVSGISGSRHIGVGIQISSNYEQFVELDVFEIWGVDDDDSRVFEFAIPGN